MLSESTRPTDDKISDWHHQCSETMQFANARTLSWYMVQWCQGAWVLYPQLQVEAESKKAFLIFAH